MTTAAGHKISETQSISPKELKGKIVDLSKYTPFLVMAGCILDILATFIPWGEMGTLHWYLPLSVPIGWPAIFMESSQQIIAVAILIKVALIVTIVSLLFYQRSNKVLFKLVLLSAVGIAGAAFVIVSAAGMVVYLGYYAVLAAAVLKIISLSLKYVELELVP
jgi:hypothetical protein